ncbi:MAG: acyl-CoA thioesterase [Gemmatimonadetes bacterium]|nr:acyl-CoA thioesterase [Gemmatimonadota bacterium]MBI3567437.1 acyl-CoA thioesterase [Gemmatimonadota bacterium]
MSCTSDFRVRYAETDQMGVVYHANYLVWCEIGRTDLIRRLGMSYADMEREGVMLAVSDVHLRLHASARYDDEVRVETRLVDARSRGVTFDYDITRRPDGARLATARITLVSIAAAGRPASMPAPIRAMLASAVEPDEAGR